jgi:hypothetical protein
MLAGARSHLMPTLMHFKITGTEHATSARRVLELDAPNRAAAEKQAHLLGLGEILHVEQVLADAQAEAAARAPRITHRGEFDEGSGKGLWFAAAAAVLAVVVAAVVYWNKTGGS